jgi:hypothetical protein
MKLGEHPMLLWASSLSVLDLVLSMDYAVLWGFGIFAYYNYNWKSRPIPYGNKSKINQKPRVLQIAMNMENFQ